LDEGEKTMLKHSIRFGLAAIALAVGLQVSGAQAAVASPALIAAAEALAPDTTSVRWVCGPLRCVWEPGYRGPLGVHPWARGWAAPRHGNCVWERVRGGPWLEVCR
jgi:hypothetical protein